MLFREHPKYVGVGSLPKITGVDNGELVEGLMSHGLLEVEKPAPSTKKRKRFAE